MRGGSQQYDERESRGGGDNAGDNAGGQRLLAAAPNTSMVSARWATKEATGVSSNVWVRRRWLDVACSGVGGRLNGDDVGGENGNGTIEARDENERVL